MADKVLLGKITRPHGVRGRLVLRVDESIEDLVQPNLSIEVRPPGAEAGTEHKIAACDRHGTGLLVKLRGLDDRNAAAELSGSEVWLDRSAIPELEDGEYYDFDVVGAQVVTADGTVIGTVTEIMITGANDVYVAKGERGEVLIPAVDVAVLEIDPDAGRIVVDADALEYQSPEDRP